MENDKHRPGGEEIGTLVHCWGEGKMVRTVENSLTVPPKGQHRITRWFSNSTPRCICKRTANRKFWSRTETQEAPQLTSTPTATTQTIERNPVMSWARATYWASERILTLERVLAHPQATKNKEGGWTITRVRDTTKSLGGGMTRFLSYMWSHGQHWKTLLLYLMPSSQYKLWRKMKSPHWVLHIFPTPAGSSLLGTPTFPAGSNPDQRPSALLALPSHLIMSQEYQKVFCNSLLGGPCSLSISPVGVWDSVPLAVTPSAWLA